MQWTYFNPSSCCHVPPPLPPAQGLWSGNSCSPHTTKLWRKSHKPPFHDGAWILFYKWKWGVPQDRHLGKSSSQIYQPLGHVGNVVTASWKILLSLFHTVTLNNEHIINVQSGGIYYTGSNWIYIVINFYSAAATIYNSLHWLWSYAWMWDVKGKRCQSACAVILHKYTLATAILNSLSTENHCKELCLLACSYEKHQKQKLGTCGMGFYCDGV